MHRPDRCIAPLLLLASACAAPAQTADRSAAPPTAPVAAPPAHPSTYIVQNGDLLVAPGLRIPNGNVPWALDTASGKQVLVPIHHAALNTTGAAGGTLQGASSHTPLHSATPVFFVHTSDRTENTGDAGRGTPTGWALLPATVTDGNRMVPRTSFADVNAATVCNAPVLCTNAESLPDGWLRITPRNPLEPGEYALLPVRRTASGGVAVVYDFSVDPQSGTAKDAVAPGQNLDSAGKQKKHR